MRCYTYEGRTGIPLIVDPVMVAKGGAVTRGRRSGRDSLPVDANGVCNYA